MARTIIQGDLPKEAVVKGNTVVLMTDAEELAPGVYSVNTEFIPFDPDDEGSKEVAERAIRTQYSVDEELAALRKAVAFLMERNGVSLDDTSASPSEVGSFAKYNRNVRMVVAACDSVGKVIQTLEGNGSVDDPYKGWTPGAEVKAGCWYLTADGYLWEAINTGHPASSLDKAYFDVVGV